MNPFKVIAVNPGECKKSKRDKRTVMPQEFSSRAKARQWCRNHYWTAKGFLILHPDGKEEVFEWIGITNK